MVNILREIVESRKKTLVSGFGYLKECESDKSENRRKPLSERIKESSGISIISEIKPASPTLGDIKEIVNVSDVAREMENAGVVGLSVLTEPEYFSGSYENLRLAVEATKFSFFEQNGSILDNNTVYGALNLRQSNKIDKLLVYVSQMSLGFSGEAFLYLKDPSGRISGTVTKEAVDKCQGFLKRGTVILLQNVTVIKTSLPNSICHLCIVFKNIVRYFLPRRKV